MRLYLATEFIEDGRTIDLISIALVSHDGREFYRQNAQAHFRAANEFVQNSVIPKLYLCPKGIPGPRHQYGGCGDKSCVWLPRHRIAYELFEWVGLISKPDGFTWQTPEFWGYYADYDWVALCQLYGAMVDLPKGWPMYCRDIKQLADDLGNPQLPAEGKDEHNALSDARWNREAHYYLLHTEGLFLPEALRGEAYARTGDEQEVPPRQVDQEPGHVRSLEAGGDGQEHSGGYQQLGVEEDRSPGQTSLEEVARSIVGKVTIDEEGVSFV